MQVVGTQRKDVASRDPSRDSSVHTKSPVRIAGTPLVDHVHFLVEGAESKGEFCERVGNEPGELALGSCRHGEGQSEGRRVSQLGVLRSKLRQLTIPWQPGQDEGGDITAGERH